MLSIGLLMTLQLAFSRMKEKERVGTRAPVFYHFILMVTFYHFCLTLLTNERGNNARVYHRGKYHWEPLGVLPAIPSK